MRNVNDVHLYYMFLIFLQKLLFICSPSIEFVWRTTYWKLLKTNVYVSVIRGRHPREREREREICCIPNFKNICMYVDRSDRKLSKSAVGINVSQFLTIPSKFFSIF